MTQEFNTEGGKVNKKKQNVKTAKVAPNGKLIPKEGLIYVSFGFDGKRHTKAHQLSDFEVRYLKEMLTEHGEQTAKSAISKAAIQNSAILCENVLAAAFLAYIKDHCKPKPVEVAKDMKETEENDNADN